MSNTWRLPVAGLVITSSPWARLHHGVIHMAADGTVSVLIEMLGVEAIHRAPLVTLPMRAFRTHHTTMLTLAHFMILIAGRKKLREKESKLIERDMSGVLEHMHSVPRCRGYICTRYYWVLDVHTAAYIHTEGGMPCMSVTTVLVVYEVQPPYSLDHVRTWNRLYMSLLLQASR
jgi:hypothetical protein